MTKLKPVSLSHHRLMEARRKKREEAKRLRRRLRRTKRAVHAKVWTYEKINKLIESLDKWIQCEGNYLLMRFCLKNNLTDTTLSRLAQRSPEFRVAIERARRHQECCLVDGALKRTFDSGFTKFILINHHGYVTDKAPSTTQASADNLLAMIENQSKDIVTVNHSTEDIVQAEAIVIEDDVAKEDV